MRQKVKPRVVVSDSMAEFFRAGGYSSDVEKFLFTDDKGVLRADWKALCEERVADYVNRLRGRESNPRLGAENLKEGL